jgi:putative aldouronate transport system substrate-binding protein
MKKIRLIGLFIAAAFLVNLGVGCSSKQQDIKILDTKDLNRQVTLDKQVTLTFCFRKEIDQAAEIKLRLDEIEKKLKSSMNIKLDFIWDSYDGDIGYNNFIKARIATGMPCEAYYYDEAQTVYHYTPDSFLNLQSITKDNLAMDISELFPKYAPNLYNKYSKEELDSATVNGKLIAIPSLFPRAIISTAIVRNDLMEKYGIKSINSLDEYEAFLKAVKQNNPELIPMTFLSSSKYLFLQQNDYISLDYRSNLVYKRDDPNMKLNFLYYEPEWKSFQNMWGRWDSNGYFKNSKGEKATATYGGLLGYSNDSTTITTEDDKLASVIGYPPIDDIVRGSNYSNEVSTFWATSKEITKFPLFPNKTAQRVSPTDTAIIIPSTAKYPEKTLEFLEWLQSSQENYDLLMYGIYGKNYTLYGDQIKPKADDSGRGFDWPGSIVFWNMDYFRTTIENKPTKKEEYMKLIETESKYPEHIGFLPDYTPVADKFYNYYIDASVPEGEVLSEFQRQLDKWRESKKK